MQMNYMTRVFLLKNVTNHWYEALSLSKQFNPTQKILTVIDFLSKRVKTQVIAKFEILQNRVERFESRRTT